MANFALDMQGFADSFSEGAERTVRGTAIRLFSAIVLATPVDSGRARGNWTTTGASPSTVVNYSVSDRSGSSTINKLTQRITTLEKWDIFTITNNLPYINTLEFGGYNDGPKTVGGYSKQAANGMVRVSVMRFNRILAEEGRSNLPR